MSKGQLEKIEKQRQSKIENQKTERIQFLNNAKRKDLIERAEEEEIEIHSKISKPIIQADLADAWKLSSFDAYFGDYSQKYSMITDIEIALRSFLVDHGVKIKYINPIYWTEAASILMYEENYIPKHPIISLLGVSIPEIFKDHWLDYLRTLVIDEYGDKIVYNALLFSDSDKMFKIAKERGYDFEKDVKLVSTFLANLFSVYQLRKILIPMNDYPRREEIVQKIVNKKWGSTTIFNIKHPGSYHNLVEDFILPFPPFPNEADYYFMYESELFEKYYCTRPDPTFNKVVQMIKNNSQDLFFYSKTQLLTGLGMQFNTIIFERAISEFNEFPCDQIVEEIRHMITTPGLYLTINTKNCETDHDYYDDQYKSFVVIYGTLDKFTCYSVQDLEGAFTDRFSRPDHPALIFKDSEIKDLVKRIDEQNNRLANYKEETKTLRYKIGQIFASRQNVDVTKFSGEEKEVAVKILFDLFYAGMYQRTWKGPAFTYPMKTEETLGSCQINIEKKMTPLLSEAKELIENFPLQYASMVQHAETVSMYGQTIDEFLNQTLAGQWCVGGGSGLLIETAYYYLTKMNVPIPNFDYEEFEKESTHRDEMEQARFNFETGEEE